MHSQMLSACSSTVVSIRRPGQESPIARNVHCQSEENMMVMHPRYCAAPPVLSIVLRTKQERPVHAHDLLLDLLPELGPRHVLLVSMPGAGDKPSDHWSWNRNRVCLEMESPWHQDFRPQAKRSTQHTKGGERSKQSPKQTVVR